MGFQERFGNLLSTWLTLFQLVTLEDWVTLATKMKHENAIGALLCVIFFITVTTYAIMNCVMAVIVQNVVDRAIVGKDDEIKKEQKEMEDALKLARSLVSDYD